MTASIVQERGSPASVKLLKWWQSVVNTTGQNPHRFELTPADFEVI